LLEGECQKKKSFAYESILTKFRLRIPYRIFTVLLMIYRVRGAILIGIFLVSIISWPRPTAVTLFPHTAAGDAAFDYFKQVVNFRKLAKIGNALDVSAILSYF
jgi:xanthine/uracil/vitamin C permease (AzgA family)